MALQFTFFHLQDHFFSMSCCDLTEMYSPAAIDAAPDINPAIQVTNAVWVDAPLAAIPTTRLVTEIIPSFAPSTAAHSHPAHSDVMFFNMIRMAHKVYPFCYQDDYNKFISSVEIIIG